MDDDALMSTRSWRWLRARIHGLLERPPLLVTYLAGEVSKIAIVPTTRVGYALDPPRFD